MALLDEAEPEKHEDESEEQTDSGGKVFVILAVIILTVFFSLNHFVGAEFALTATLCVATTLVAIGICWDLRRRLWFWGVIVFMMGLHAPLVLMVRWPHQWIPGIALMPIGIVDCMVMVGIVRFIQKSVVKDVPPDEQA